MMEGQQENEPPNGSIMPVDMSRHFTIPSLLKYATPSIAMMIFTSVYGIIDGLFVSQCAGKTAFAAINLAMPLFMVLGSFGFMMGTGGIALVSKLRGAGRDEQANRTFSLVTYVTIAGGLLLTALGYLIAGPYLQMLGASDDLFDMALLYTRISLVSLFAFLLQFYFQTFFVAAGKPQLGFVIVVIAGCANIVFDALFIYILGWGVAGAATATCISEFIGGLVPLVYFSRRNSSFLRLGRTSMSWKTLGKVSANGSSEFVANISGSIVATLYNYQLMSIIGSDGVAAYGTVQYLMWVFAAVFMGFSLGVSPLMSFQYGALNWTEMRSLFRKGIGVITVCGISMFAISELFATPLASLFVGYDADLTDLTVHALRIFALSFLLMGFSMYGSSLFTSLGNGPVSAAISFLRSLVFESGSVILLPLVFGADGIWYSIIVAETASVIVTTCFIFLLGPRYHIDGALFGRKSKSALRS